MELTSTGRENCNMLTCSLENSGFTDSILRCSCTCFTHCKWVMLEQLSFLIYMLVDRIFFFCYLGSFYSQSILSQVSTYAISWSTMTVQHTVFMFFFLKKKRTLVTLHIVMLYWVHFLSLFLVEMIKKKS